MNNSIKNHHKTTGLPYVKKKKKMHRNSLIYTLMRFFLGENNIVYTVYIINLFWVFLLHKLKMLMFWCFDCVSKPNFQDNFWWIRRFSALPLNRTSKASSGLVISTSTQFITYIQSLESVLRILVWGGLHINHTLI